MCKDYPSCDIAYNAVMPLSHAPTRGRYSRIVGVTGRAAERERGGWARAGGAEREEMNVARVGGRRPA